MMANAYYLFHGSTISDIPYLEPRKRYTPGNEKDSPPCVYATDDPAFAAAHAFSWSSDEGIDLYYDNDEERQEPYMHLEIPQALAERLKQTIYIYKVQNKDFEWVQAEVVGRTYRSLNKVETLVCQRFNTVIEAVEHFKGKVIIKS